MDIKKIFLEAMEDFKAQNNPSCYRDPRAYQEWLAQTYFFVRHSTALLGFALPYLQSADLRHHFEKHLGEETRHDLVALRDLQKMNRKIEEFSESIYTQAFYQSQYYRVQFEGGTSLLGYILFLEGIAVHWGKDFYETVKNLHGGTQFAKVHVNEDPEHLEGALKTILALNTDQQEAIIRNFYYSKQMYESIISLTTLNNSMPKVA